MFMLFHFTESKRFLNAWQLVKRSLHPLVRLVAILSFTVATSAHAQVFLLIDEDSIDNGISTIEDISFSAPFCGSGDPAVCVNDDIADPGERRLLFTRGDAVILNVCLAISGKQTFDQLPSCDGVSPLAGYP